MSFLLDTNVCIALMNQTSEWMRRRFEENLASSELMYLSVIVRFELEYGIAKSATPYANMRRLQDLIENGVELLEFDSVDAAAAGSLRSTLEREARSIGPYDVLMPGRRGLAG